MRDGAASKTATAKIRRVLPERLARRLGGQRDPGTAFLLTGSVPHLPQAELRARWRP
jgi:hypothetical protein